MNKAFSLAELSIVLIIISLLVAGALGGQSLVKQAKLRTIISDYNRFNTAIHIFKLEYSEFPGELRNADSYWPSCVDIPGSTCNGSGSIWDNDENRLFRVWQHLSLSGIINHDYNGDYRGGGDLIKPGINSPKSKIIETTWSIASIDEIENIGSYNFRGLMLGRLDDDEPADTKPYRGSITPKDAFIIDKKIDDGLPTNGILISINELHSSGNTCIFNNSGTHQYLLSSKDQSCVLMVNLKID